MSNGPATSGGSADAHSNLPFDPSKNVLDKVDDAVERLDDLQALRDRRQDDLRACSEKLSNVKHAHLKEIVGLHAEYAAKLNVKETDRIDAIRAVDVNAAAIAQERVSASATVLANQVSASAEALRALVATTAGATSTATAATFQQMTDRLAVLERSSYEGSGKAAVADPAIARMVEELAALRLNGADKTGRGVGMEKLWGWFAAAALLGVAVLNSAGKIL